MSSSKTVIILGASEGFKLPYSEGFDGQNFPPSGWVVQPAGDLFAPWSQINTIKKSGTASITSLNTILAFDNSGRRENIFSPLLDLSSISHPVLSFDVAYNYHLYTPPVLQDTQIFADTLEVLISTDCGNNFTLLYRKGGKELSTFLNPIHNPLNITSAMIKPGLDNWRKEEIDLSNYRDIDNAIIKFSYISGLGGSIAIDNFSVSTHTTSIHRNQFAEISLYPNPATSNVLLSFGSLNVNQIQLINTSGQIVKVVQVDNKPHLNLDLTNLISGLYIVKVIADNNIFTKRLIVL